MRAAVSYASNSRIFLTMTSLRSTGISVTLILLVLGLQHVHGFRAAAARRVLPTTRLSKPSVVASAATAAEPALSPILTRDAVDAWERIDDVIMGGVSSSRLVEGEDCAVFEGTLREEGGGFCGQRLKLLATPLDLSSQEGLYVDCEADADADKRVWKMAVRTRQDRGEIVYQATLKPKPLQRERFFLPWSDFRLVRGPRLVPDAPPLSAESVNATFQISLVVSKFTISDNGAALPNFLQGKFRMAIFSLGSFASAEQGAQVELPPALTQAEQAASAPLPIRVLRPVLGLIFGETRRRRRAATLLLQARGLGAFGRVRYGWSLRRAGGRCGPLRAAGRSLGVLSQDAAAALISLPVQLLFKIVFTTIRLVRRAKQALGMTPPKMPPLTTA